MSAASPSGTGPGSAGGSRSVALLAAVRSSPRAARFERAARTRHGAAALESSGRFDQRFYEAQAGEVFDSLAAAVRHYCSVGWRTDLSPHPLYDPTVHLHDPVHRRELVRTPFEVFLRACRSPQIRAHRLFDAPGWWKTHPAAAQHPQGAWGHFLDSAEAAPAGSSPALPLTGLPGSIPVIRYADLVANAYRHARIWSAQRRIENPDRLSDSFDAAAAAALRRRLAGIAPPAGVAGAPVVSVITPVRNRPQQVLSAIASVLHQTLADWELIVVDDGSTDDTADVVAGLAAADPRIRLLREAAGGVCVARNAGAAAARGTYLAWLDSDTTWEPDFLRLALTAMAHDGLRVAHAAQQFTDDAGRVRFRQFPGGVEHLSVGNFVDLNVLLAERSVVAEVGGFDPGLRRAVDYDLVLRLAAVTELAYLPIIGSVYADDLAGADRIGVRELRTWNYVVRERAFLDWERLQAAAPGRVPGLTSLLISARNQGASVYATVHSVLVHTSGPLEVVVVDGASRLPEALRTGTAELLDPARVRVIRTVVNLNSGVGHNVAFARSNGDRVVLLRAGISVDDGWLTPLLDGLDDPDRWVATAPLLVSARGLVESAGTVFAPGGSLPVPLLAGLFEADARRLLAAHGGALTVPAANGRVLAVRAVDYAAVHGYDPLYVDGPDDADLCLRLGQLRGTAVGVVPDSVVRTTPLRRQRQSAGGVPDARLFNARWRGLLAAGKVAGSVDPAELWAGAGFDLIGFVADDDPGVPADAAHVRPLVRWRAERPGTAPSLRWTVDISALADVPESLAAVRGAAAQLARALADCGQVAAVRRPGTPVWPSEHDDVVVSVGGRVAARPVPAAVNVLWLPEGGFVAAAQEAIGFDLVLAADPVAAGSLVRRVADAASRLAGRPGAAAPAVVVLDSPLVGFGDSAAAIDELVGRVLEIAARRAPGPGRA